MEVPDGKRPDAETASPESDVETTSPEQAAGQVIPVDTAIPAGRNQGEAIRPESVTKEAPRSRSFYVKRHRAAVLLFIVFVIMLASAFLIYPNRGPVYRPQPFNVEIDATGVASINIIVSGAAHKYSLVIAPYYLPASSPSITFYVDLPYGVTPTDCGKPNCSVETFDDVPGMGASNVVEANQASLSLSLNVENPAFAWKSNGLDLEGQLPQVQVDPAPHSKGQPVNPNVTIYYVIPNGNSYDWTGGPEPAYEPLGWEHIYGPPGASFEPSEVWYQSVDSLASPIPISGNDNSAANSDNLRIFVAGALLGIAGGALVGAIQEFTHKEEQPPIVLGSSLRVDLSPRRPPHDRC